MSAAPAIVRPIAAIRDDLAEIEADLEAVHETRRRLFDRRDALERELFAAQKGKESGE